MKNTFKTTQLIAVLVLFGLSTLSVAQDKDNRRGDRDNSNRFERITESLDLTVDQIAQLEALQEQRQLAKEENQEARQQNRADLNEALMGILSSEQWESYQELQENRSSRRNRNKGGNAEEGTEV